ncbi:hypothetical protein [Roseibium sp. Sym1]|uniref:hypothetical protein n=1 Tax=Roseibium sp. Sym1 TaxID=3016006 RepID=UPI0022B4B247|nr:hypothetical protein [Roseibium sp. Sym1]
MGNVHVFKIYSRPAKRRIKQTEIPNSYRTTSGISQKVRDTFPKQLVAKDGKNEPAVMFWKKAGKQS